MRRAYLFIKIIAIAVLLYIAGAAAQNWTPVTGTNVTEYGGTKLASGIACVLGVDQKNNAIGSESIATTLTLKNVEGIRYAHQFASGSSTGGIQEAINDFGAAPACGSVILPRGVVAVSKMIDVNNREGCDIGGQGGGQGSSTATTTLKWTGASGGTVFRVYSTRWSHFHDFIIDGDSLAGKGFDDTALNSVGANQKNRFERITISGVTQKPSIALHVGSSTTTKSVKVSSRI